MGNNIAALLVIVGIISLSLLIGGTLIWFVTVLIAGFRRKDHASPE